MRNPETTADPLACKVCAGPFVLLGELGRFESPTTGELLRMVGARCEDCGLVAVIEESAPEEVN